MEPIISPHLIYWINTLDNLKFVSILISIISILLSILFILYKSDEYEPISEDAKLSIAKCRKIIICSIIVLIVIGVFVPSKSTMMEMLIVNYITPDNIFAGTEIFKEAIEFTIQKITEAAKALR